jgi:hypothetical protein
MVFESAKQMLETLDCMDLYNTETENYVFLYNECGSICVYQIEKEMAIELDKKSREADGEQWSAFLGTGGSIYDDPRHELFDAHNSNNLDYCEEFYNKGNWIDTRDYFKEVVGYATNEKVLKACDEALSQYGADMVSVDLNTENGGVDINLCTRHWSDCYKADVARYDRLNVKELEKELDKRNVGHCW